MWYDVLVVGVLIFAVMRGAAKGIVWQLATIAALVLCFLFSQSLSLTIAPYITLKPPLNRWVAMFALYMFFSFLSFGAARSLKKWIEKAQFVEYDRHLGAVFGFVKGVIFVLVMTFFSVTLTQQMPETRDAIFHSQTGKMSAIIMDRLHPMMPEELHAVLEPFIHSLDRPGLDLQHSHDHEGHADLEEHDHKGSPLEPIEAPPFPQSPRRNDLDAPPFESVNNPADDPALPDFFDSDFPLPNLPALPKNPVNRPSTGAKENDGNLRVEREKLLLEMAGVLAADRAAQRAIISEVENSLSGLPDQIKISVVKDWYSDLLIYDTNADPDKGTDLTTPFDTRILRQLTRNKVPLSSLNTALQERLQNTRR